MDSGSTKSILGEEEFKQEIKHFEVEAILFRNGSIESVFGHVALPSILDVAQKCVEYQIVPNFKYQCFLGMNAIRQFKITVVSDIGESKSSLISARISDADFCRLPLLIAYILLSIL